LNGVWGSGLDDVFAAGGIREDSDGGIKTAIMHFNGTSWSRMDIPDIPGFIHFIQGNSSGRVCTLSSSGYLMIFDGTKWNVSTTGLSGNDNRSDFVDFFYINDDDVYLTRALGFYIQLYHYNGEAWISPLDSGSLWGIWASNGNDVYVAAGRAGLHHYDGADWSLIQIPDAVAIDVWGSSKENVYVIAPVDMDNNALLHFNGFSWDIVTEQIPLKHKPIRISGSDQDDVYVHGVVYEVDGSVGIAQESIVYHYDGNKCSKMRIPQSWIIMNIWAASEGEAFAVGYDREDEKARIFRYSCGQ